MQIGGAYLQVLCDRFARPIQDAAQIVPLAGTLHLNQNLLLIARLHQQIHPIELILFAFLVALAFKNRFDLNLFLEQLGQESFQDIKIRWVSQDMLDGSVKPDQSVCRSHTVMISIFSNTREGGEAVSE